MFGISTINTVGFRSAKPARKAAVSNCSILSMRRCTGVQPKKDFTRKNKNKSLATVDLRLEVKTAWVVLVLVCIFSGVFYLYEVNDLAAKGYELKELQSKVASLQEANKKGVIKKVELMSMYNIEKATQNSNLVSLNNATYLELNGPMAMK